MDTFNCLYLSRDLVLTREVIGSLCSLEDSKLQFEYLAIQILHLQGLELMGGRSLEREDRGAMEGAGDTEEKEESCRRGTVTQSVHCSG